MQTSDQVIRAKNLVYHYSDSEFAAVNDVSMDVRRGEFLAILGRNGSGKSTLAKLFNALILPASGTLEVEGIQATDEAGQFAVREKCGMVFQNPDNQLVATIVEEDVAFGLENLGIPSAEIRQRVDAALRVVGMSDYALSAPHMLSGGQKQRIAIAGVIAMRPDIIVFDEATAMLDPSGRREVMNVVEKLRQDTDVTVIWITHFMDEAARADRLLIMDQGKITLEGTPRAVFANTDKVRGMGLDVPEMAELAKRLAQNGIYVRDGIMTVPEMTEELCRLKSEI